MAATKLNLDASLFPCPYAVHHHPATPLLQYHADVACPPGSPVGVVYFYAQFPFPSPQQHPFVQFPVTPTCHMPARVSHVTLRHCTRSRPSLALIDGN
jgi:hypothetical protein